MSRPKQTIAHIPIERLTAHPANIRTGLGDLTEMAASIREHGILQPLTATEDLLHEGRLLLLAGHRRLAASRIVGLPSVPVIIHHDVTDPAEHLIVMLVENTQRRDINPIERAEAYGKLRDRGLTIGQIGRRTGASNSTVSHYLNLLMLSPEEKDEIKAGHRAVSNVLNQVRAERQDERLREGGRPRGRPKGAKTKPYFSETHPLARAARAACGHRGVPKVGNVACGACWESTIRHAEASRSEPAALG